MPQRRMTHGLCVTSLIMASRCYGHLDFKPGFQALVEMGFDGYMVLECQVPGDPYEDLPKTAQYLRAQMP